MKPNYSKKNTFHELLYLHVEKNYKLSFTKRRLKGKSVVVTDISWKNYIKSIHNDLSKLTSVYDVFKSDLLQEESYIDIFTDKIKNKELLSLMEGRIIKDVIYPPSKGRLRDKVIELSKTRDVVELTLLAVSLDVLSDLPSVVV